MRPSTRLLLEAAKILCPLVISSYSRVVMWMSLSDAASRTLQITTEHILGDPEVYPAIRHDVLLQESTERAGASTMRIKYTIDKVESPASSSQLQAQLARAEGASFELLLSERGCLLGPQKTDPGGPTWFIASLGEDLRTAWSIPAADGLKLGTTWQEKAAMPRDLPDAVQGASARAQHRVTSLEGDWLELESAFEVSVKITERGKAGPLHGGGKQYARLHRTQGIMEVRKETKVLVNLASGPEPAAILRMSLRAAG